MFRQRPHLLWLLVPFALFLVAPPWVNRVDPVVLGLPFLAFWLLASTLLTPVAVWLAHRGDQRLMNERAGGPAHADGTSGDSGSGNGGAE